MALASPNIEPPAGRRAPDEIVSTVVSDHIPSGALPEGMVIREKTVSAVFGTRPPRSR